MSAILGVSCYFHDAAAALLRDGDLVAAAEEERFSRRKHDSGFPAHAIDFCLEQGGLARGELDYVVFYEKPLVKLQRIAATVLATAPRGQAPFARTLEAWTGERVWIRRRLAERLGVARDRVLFVDHHLAHAASAFLASPFDEAALLTVDGVGEWTTAAIGRGAPGSVTLEREIRFPHSLGLFYTAFTAFLGFEVNEGEYKVMGMAPYGEPRLVEEVRRTIDLHGDGSFSLDLDYFAFQHSLARPYSSRFEELFGVPARDPRDDFVTAATHPGASRADVERSRVYADIAASAQAVLEDTVVGLANEAHRRTGLDTLCLAGGVALNGVANRRLLERTPFTGLFIPPAPGDSGGALGAALYADHVLLGRTRRFVMEHAYWGRAYAREEIDAALAAHGAAYERLDEEALCAHVADELAAGRVVGWFQGRFEWGPRALGNRSILADPRSTTMKARVNETVKFREPFRPFAPSVLEERAGELVDGDPAAQLATRFMLLVLPLKDGAGEAMPAVDHFGTARVQTVRADYSPLYYRLISAFADRTGLPALLNTSFNLRGEPIVASPADALSTFARSDLDLLVLEDAVVRKR